MLDFSFKLHQIQFRLGLTALPRSKSWIWRRGRENGGGRQGKEKGGERGKGEGLRGAGKKKDAPGIKHARCAQRKSVSF